MRVGIVNDLSLAVAVLSRVVESVPEHSVAWTAADGAEAVRRVAADRPDVILMDLIMPELDGVEATRAIMAKHPCPIIIVTASVGANYGKVYEALGAGGLDAVKTPTFGPGGRVEGQQPLLDRLAKLSRQQKSASPGNTPAQADTNAPITHRLAPMVVIGASTGGPHAIAEVLRTLGPTPQAAIVVVQHISPDFATGFGRWLADQSGHSVETARTGDEPYPGRVYVAGSDDHLIVAASRRFAYTPDPLDYPYRPSVDVFFQSVAERWPSRGVGVLLTGMGSDGARGLLALRNRGWHTIAQDQATSIVFGMPKVAIEAGAASEVLPLSRIGPAIRGRLIT